MAVDPDPELENDNDADEPVDESYEEDDSIEEQLEAVHGVD